MGQEQSSDGKGQSESNGVPICDCISGNRMQTQSQRHLQQPRSRAPPPAPGAQAPGGSAPQSLAPGKSDRPSAEISCGMTSASPLHLASARGDVLSMQVMIREGYFAVDCRDNIGRTPMMLACIYGQLAAAKLLLEFGASLEAEDTYGRRPLIFAMEEQHWHVADWIKWHAWDTEQKKAMMLSFSPEREVRRGVKPVQAPGPITGSFKGSVSRVSDDGLPERSPRVMREPPSPDLGPHLGWDKDRKLMTF